MKSLHGVTFFSQKFEPHIKAYKSISLDRIFVLLSRIPRFKVLGIRNLQYQIRICKKSHNTVNCQKSQLHFLCGSNFYETDVNHFKDLKSCTLCYVIQQLGV